MKRILTLFLLLGLLLAGCNTNPPEPTDPTPTTTEPPSVTVGILYYGAADNLLPQVHRTGLEQAMEELGLDPRAQILTAANTTEKTAAQAIDALIGMGAELMIGTDLCHAGAVAAAAEANPKVRFLQYGGGEETLPNLAFFHSRFYQTYYLSGVAVAMKAKDLGYTNLGFLCNLGRDPAEARACANAFALGVQAIDPGMSVFVTTLEEGATPAEERKAAYHLIIQEKCYLLAQYSQSDQVLDLMGDLLLYGCGSFASMEKTAPKAHIVSPVLDWSACYKLALETAMGQNAAAFWDTVGCYLADLENGGIDLYLGGACHERTDAFIRVSQKIFAKDGLDSFCGYKYAMEFDDRSFTIWTPTPAALKDQDGNTLLEEGAPPLSWQEIRELTSFVEGIRVVPSPEPAE